MITKTRAEHKEEFDNQSMTETMRKFEAANITPSELRDFIMPSMDDFIYKLQNHDLPWSVAIHFIDETEDTENENAVFGDCEHIEHADEKLTEFINKVKRIQEERKQERDTKALAKKLNIKIK